MLLSRGLPTEVPSPRPGLASRFGMETGRLPGAIAAANLQFSEKTRRQPGNRRTDAKKTNTIKPVTTTLHAVDKPLPCFQTESDDLRSLVLVSSTPYDASTSSLSNTCSTCDLSFLEGTRSPHLGDGFPLRCFQRLSDPEVANQPRPWRDDWHTRVPSTPVLSY